MQDGGCTSHDTAGYGINYTVCHTIYGHTVAKLSLHAADPFLLSRPSNSVKEVGEIKEVMVDVVKVSNQLTLQNLSGKDLF